jgi:hypothetical protein
MEIITIQNINNYDQEIIDGNLILTPKKSYIEEYEFMRLPFKKSIILNCLIKGQIDKEEIIISEKKKYKPILVDIWKSMPTQKILQNTTFNFKLTDEKGEKGYYWCNDINMSFQCKDAEWSIKEIIKMIHLNKYKLDISIQTEENNIYHFKI